LQVFFGVERTRRMVLLKNERLGLKNLLFATLHANTKYEKNQSTHLL
jgi:hypothetical protein